MNLFSETFVTLLIIGSLLWTSVGGLLLLFLFIKDLRAKKLW